MVFSLFEQHEQRRFKSNAGRLEAVSICVVLFMCIISFPLPVLQVLDLTPQLCNARTRRRNHSLNMDRTPFKASIHPSFLPSCLVFLSPSAQSLSQLSAWDVEMISLSRHEPKFIRGFSQPPIPPINLPPLPSFVVIFPSRSSVDDVLASEWCPNVKVH